MLLLYNIIIYDIWMYEKCKWISHSLINAMIEIGRWNGGAFSHHWLLGAVSGSGGQAHTTAHIQHRIIHTDSVAQNVCDHDFRTFTTRVVQHQQHIHYWLAVSRWILHPIHAISWLLYISLLAQTYTGLAVYWTQSVIFRHKCTADDGFPHRWPVLWIIFRQFCTDIIRKYLWLLSKRLVKSRV